MIYKSIIGKEIELTDERRQHIISRHPDVATHFTKASTTLVEPDEIRIDKEDKNVLLFYKYFSKIGSGKYLVVAVKFNKRNFLLTLYSTHRIRTGEKYEIKQAS
ncbi:MAG: hypothetical protein UU23_C0003G0008 [Candidatus Curtissbacteria bacterium GW2011_GWA1_40_9]|uniref:Phage-Barnase-EndoU-ColicinE5/D-RelE like nuclease 3 domain-containing protein n=1 Tax=Candidatus Curtissbacteria bacterium GW2011_GWA1_40_9 TaxID=1618408 RepID=A0A0G0W1B4_9BACT|nr:MAG: hypothetical protein UU23_C0003G0008 [Candidatus Curtissbacteria bacterium GW2011_GWA1_40_9]